VDRYGYIESKSVVVEDIDGKEEHYVPHPPRYRDSIWLEEQGRVVYVKVVVETLNSNEDELGEGDERPYEQKDR